MQFAWIGLVAGLATGSMLGETAWWSLAGFILGFYLDQRRQWQRLQRGPGQARQPRLHQIDEGVHVSAPACATAAR